MTIYRLCTSDSTDSTDLFSYSVVFTKRVGGNKRAGRADFFSFNRWKSVTRERFLFCLLHEKFGSNPICNCDRIKENHWIWIEKEWKRIKKELKMILKRTHKNWHLFSANVIECTWSKVPDYEKKFGSGRTEAGGCTAQPRRKRAPPTPKRPN